MKQLILMLCTIVCVNTYAQTVYLADTAFVTDVGFGGAPTSCKTNGMTYSAVNMDRIYNIWVADAFTVPTGATWIFDTVIVYGYQFGGTLTSPFLSCNLQIYSGTPGAGGSVIWGDTVTNVLKGSAFTGIYKVDTHTANGGLMATNRPIMYLKLHLNPAPHLTAGTYWMSWSATCSTSTSATVTPYKVLPGRLNPPGELSKVFIGGSWLNAVDNGNNIGFNMIIKGKPGLAGFAEQEHEAANLLSQNVPNPFSNTSNITYTLADDSYVKLSVYNILGQVVATLADGHMSRGQHEISFNAGELPAGTYYYQISTAAGTESRQMVVMR